MLIPAYPNNPLEEKRFASVPLGEPSLYAKMSLDISSGIFEWDPRDDISLNTGVSSVLEGPNTLLGGLYSVKLVYTPSTNGNRSTSTVVGLEQAFVYNFLSTAPVRIISPSDNSVFGLPIPGAEIEFKYDIPEKPKKNSVTFTIQEGPEVVLKVILDDAYREQKFLWNPREDITELPNVVSLVGGRPTLSSGAYKMTIEYTDEEGNPPKSDSLNNVVVYFKEDNSKLSLNLLSWSLIGIIVSFAAGLLVFLLYKFILI